ncbi:MAG: PAS domain S-box protein, partial [Deltaproteobacteria bacterium]
MSHAGKTKKQLLVELEELHLRISELKKQQMEWGQSKGKPIESEENFRALAENANDGIMIALGDGVYVYANRRATEI